MNDRDNGTSESEKDCQQSRTYDVYLVTDADLKTDDPAESRKKIELLIYEMIGRLNERLYPPDYNRVGTAKILAEMIFFDDETPWHFEAVFRVPNHIPQPWFEDRLTEEWLKKGLMLTECYIGSDQAELTLSPTPQK